MESINADMTIGEVIRQHPQTVNIMLSFGLHCVGCGANPYETIREGTLGHGMSEEELSALLADLNKSVAATPKKEPSQAKSASQSSSHEGPVVKVTGKAVTKAKEFMQSEKKEGYGLRINVVPGGCSGMNYELDFENTEKPDDLVYEQHGMKIFVAKGAVQYIQGMELDYLENLTQQGFIFNNPNAVNTCGCGSSFSA